MPAVVQLAFGSFGDIVALLQLIAELCTALHAARDSSNDIRALVDDLMAFSCAIDEIKIALERRHTALHPGLLNGITNAVALCHTMLLEVQRRIDKFHQRRLRGLGPVAWGKYHAAVAWAICGEKRVVATLKRRMWEQLGLIHTLMTITQINDQDGLFSAVNAQKASLQQLHHWMRELHYLSDGYPPFFFVDKDGSRFKPIVRMTVETFHALLSHHPWAKHFTTPSSSDGGPVHKYTLTLGLRSVLQEREVHWVYHRSVTAKHFMVFLGLPCIRWDPEIYDLVRYALEKVPGLTMMPRPAYEMGYQAAAKPSDSGYLPIVHFLSPALLNPYTIRTATSEALLLKTSLICELLYQEGVRGPREILECAQEYLGSTDPRQWRRLSSLPPRCSFDRRSPRGPLARFARSFCWRCNR